MYIVLAVVVGCFGILCFLARGEDVGAGVSGVFLPFGKVALYLYKRVCRRLPRSRVSAEVERDLLLLNPGEPSEVLKADFYVKKVALCLAILVLGSIMGALAKASASEESFLSSEGTLLRGEYAEGPREISVIADYEDEEYSFTVEVVPRKLTESEVREMFSEMLLELPEHILGENESLDRVWCDLVLKENYDAYPVTVKWDSSRPDILTSGGRVGNIEKQEEVVLSVCLAYEEYQENGEFHVVVIPEELTERELIYRELEELLRLSGKDTSQEKWQLPVMWRGEEIVWRTDTTDSSLVICVLTLFATVAVYLCADRDLHEQIQKRKRSLQKEYPEIVHKLVLFVGAGMTLRGAFYKIAGDYEKKKQKKVRPAYEEMLHTCHELRTGVSEGAAYEHFGKRTGIPEYIRLSALLMQNLKRGNNTLPERLREEADKASEERLQRCRKLGEEAGTKLLVPMVLMLGVVMVVIMTPAFMTM